MSEMNIKFFKRSPIGYNSKQVNAVVTELQREIEKLNEQNVSLTNTIEQYNSKIQQLAETTKQLEENRTNGNSAVRLLNQALQVAEKTELEALKKASEITENAQLETKEIIEKAHQEAGKIRAQAQTDYVNAKAELDIFIKNMHIICQSGEELKTRFSAMENSVCCIPSEVMEDSCLCTNPPS